VVSDIEMASELNRYFASVFQEPDEKSPLPNIEQLDCEQRFDMVAFDETKIRKASGDFRVLTCHPETAMLRPE